MEECQAMLLWCATPDAVIRLQEEWCTDVYFNQQQHDSLAKYLQARLQTVDEETVLMAQVLHFNCEAFGFIIVFIIL